MSLFDRMGQSNQQNQLQQIKNNPIAMGRQAGYQIPDNLAGNPQAIVQHLIQTGQVGGPMMQRIMPMIQRMTGK
jgi:hypothetical protein